MRADVGNADYRTSDFPRSGFNSQKQGKCQFWGWNNTNLKVPNWKGLGLYDLSSSFWQPLFTSCLWKLYIEFESPLFLYLCEKLNRSFPLKGGKKEMGKYTIPALRVRRRKRERLLEKSKVSGEKPKSEDWVEAAGNLIFIAHSLSKPVEFGGKACKRKEEVRRNSVIAFWLENSDVFDAGKRE